MAGTVKSADGVAVRYEVHGGGPRAVVLVHGWSCDRGYWREQVGHFADRFTVVTVDLAGHGESGADRERFTMPAFGADVAAVADALGLAEMVLVGHSMGGDVIVEAACLLPDRVRGLVWVDVYRSLDDAGSGADTVDAFMAPFRADFPAATRAFVRRLLGTGAQSVRIAWVSDDMAAAPPAIALSAMRHAMTNERPAIAGLRRAGVPTVAINPAQPPTDVDSLARHGVTTMTLAGVGHFLMLEDPPGFNRLLDGALETFV
jgi:pimeloyl-ACP methyl ester carboxylesterase